MAIDEGKDVACCNISACIPCLGRPHSFVHRDYLCSVFYTLPFDEALFHRGCLTMSSKFSDMPVVNENNFLEHGVLSSPASRIPDSPHCSVGEAVLFSAWDYHRHSLWLPHLVRAIGIELVPVEVFPRRQWRERRDYMWHWCVRRTESIINLTLEKEELYRDEHRQAHWKGKKLHDRPHGASHLLDLIQCPNPCFRQGCHCGACPHDETRRKP
mmetsp:Transcript_148023/g.258144  ORF Transcript_148023/g.258144 Transcript_148023/m.258144 type:complete len:213 (+) Transcript_148023:1729-2367(+)